MRYLASLVLPTVVLRLPPTDLMFLIETAQSQACKVRSVHFPNGSSASTKSLSDKSFYAAVAVFPAALLLLQSTAEDLVVLPGATRIESLLASLYGHVNDAHRPNRTGRHQECPLFGRTNSARATDYAH